MKQIRQWVLTGVALASLNVNAQPLYWFAHKDSLEFLLIGTIHIGDASMYPLPQPVTEFLAQSDALVLEADISTKPHYTSNNEGVTTQEVLDDAQQEQLRNISYELDLSPVRLLNASPWMVAATLQVKQMEQLGYSAEYGVESILIDQAQAETLPILGLETLDEQADALASVGENGTALLIDTLERWQESEHDFKCLVTSWQQGQQATLNQLLEDSDEQVMDVLARDRNKQWLERLVSNDFLPNANGRYTIAVGTLHLMGKDSLISLLTEHGFEVTPVIPKQSPIPDCE